MTRQRRDSAELKRGKQAGFRSWWSRVRVVAGLALALAQPGGGVFSAQAAVTAPPGSALTQLKQVQISGGDQIDLLFDRKIKQDQIKVEYFGEIIQLVIQDASVYPAKISSVSGPELTKVFAYQYSPKVVRTRLTIKGRAEEFEKRLKLAFKGRVVTLSIGESPKSPPKTDLKASELKTAAGAVAGAGPREAESEKKLQSLPASVVPVVAQAGMGAEGKPPHATSESSALSSSAALAGASAPGGAAASLPSEKLNKVEPPASPKSGTKAINGLGLKKSGPSFKRTGLILGSMFVILFLLAWVLKKAKRASANPQSASPSTRKLLEALRSFSGRGRDGGPQIEVISNHALGPKKSIAVVKVAGKTLVLGVSDDSINLITPLEDDHAMGVGALGRDAEGKASEFSKLIDEKAIKGGGAAASTATRGTEPVLEQSAKRAAHSVIRNQIRSRLEGLKSL